MSLGLDRVTTLAGASGLTLARLWLVAERTTVEPESSRGPTLARLFLWHDLVSDLWLDHDPTVGRLLGTRRSTLGKLWDDRGTTLGRP